MRKGYMGLGIALSFILSAAVGLSVGATDNGYNGGHDEPEPCENFAYFECPTDRCNKFCNRDYWWDGGLFLGSECKPNYYSCMTPPEEVLGPDGHPIQEACEDFAYDECPESRCAKICNRNCWIDPVDGGRRCDPNSCLAEDACITDPNLAHDEEPSAEEPVTDEPPADEPTPAPEPELISEPPPDESPAEEPSAEDTPTDPTREGGYDVGAATSSTVTIDADRGILRALDSSSLSCGPGTLIKGESSDAVYYCGGDGKRYVFPNQRVFETWYENFDSVITLTDAELARVPLGGIITYRPGVKMVKIQSDPKVYAVSRGGLLRWVTTEEVAVALYGPGWNTQIDDVDPSFFFGYTIGDPITIEDVGQ